jgi:hypothetical protein
MKMETKLTGLDGVLDMLKALPPEVVSKNGGPVRLALRRGAVLLAKQAKINFDAAVQQVGKSGITDTTGFTGAQIKPKRRKPPSGVKGEKFVVTVNYVLHPSGKTYRKRPIRANDIAFTMEHGTSKQPATPWLAPAFAAKAPEAISTIERELPRAIERIAKRLGAQKKG